MAHSAVSIADAVAAGQAVPVEVLAEYVSRHEATKAALNALVQCRQVAARGEAEQMALQLQEGVVAGPLVGVPVSVKECFPVAGMVTSLGIPARRKALDTADASIVVRLRAAGALIVGKGNVPQAMYLHETDNPVWGRTNHPFNADRGPGGSSGGDAALVAAGVVPLAVGTDLAGSIRQPAHACGITGFVPRSSVIGDGGGFDTMPHLTVVRPRAGFLAREVGDLTRAFEVLGAPVLSSAELSHGGLPPEQRGRAELGGGLRIAWWDDAGPIEPSPAVSRAVHEAVNRLAGVGAETVRLDGRLATEAAWLHLALLSADGGADVRRLFAGTRPIPPVALLLRLAGIPIWLRPLLASCSQMAGGGIEATALRVTGPRRGEALARLCSRRLEFAARFAATMTAFDALVCPVSALPALRHGTAARLVVAAAPCMLANLLDLPAGTVPVTSVRPEEETGRASSRDRVVQAARATDRGSRGLPVGVQVVGVPDTLSAADPLRSERLVLEVMRLIECGPAKKSPHRDKPR